MGKLLSKLTKSRHRGWQRLWRLLRLRLIIPMFRSRQSPERTARAVAVGLFWAFTPTFGIQMVLTLFHWYIARTFFNKGFNVVIAMAWTWVTNVFTVPVCYYVFFLTGQVVLGRWDDLSGFSSFNQFWLTVMGETGSDPTSLIAWEKYFSIIVEGWGLALVIGFIPYSILGYLIGYSWSLRIIRRWRRTRLERRRAKIG